MAGEVGGGVSPSSDRPPGTPQAGIQEQEQAVLDLGGCHHVSWLAAVVVWWWTMALSAGSQIE